MVHHRHSPMHVLTIQHGCQQRIANSRLTGNIQITVCECNAFHSILISRLHIGFNAVRTLMRLKFLQQCLICLEVACTCMETQNAHEHVLVVGQICHLFDIIDMRMLAKMMYRLSWNLFILEYTTIYQIYTRYLVYTKFIHIYT